MPFKNLPSHLKPREKAIIFGIESLNDFELLALILRTGSKNFDVLELAKKLFMKYQNFHQLLSAPIQELIQIPGIAKVKALELKAIQEIDKRYHHKVQLKVKSYAQVIDLAYLQIKNWNQEFFVLILLDQSLNLLHCQTLYQASDNKIIVRPRDIMKKALQQDAAAFYCVHSHPSGNHLPSKADQIFTLRLRYLCKQVQLNLIEHLVICENKRYSIIA